MDPIELIAAKYSLRRVGKKGDESGGALRVDGLSERQKMLCSSNEYAKRPHSFSFMGRTMIIDHDIKVSRKLYVIMQELALREAERIEEEEKQIRLKTLQRKQREMEQDDVSKRKQMASQNNRKDIPSASTDVT